MPEFLVMKMMHGGLGRILAAVETGERGMMWKKAATSSTSCEKRGVFAGFKRCSPTTCSTSCSGSHRSAKVLRVLSALRKTREICKKGRKIRLHVVSALESERYVLMQGELTKPYHIPYRVIAPEGIDGLLAPGAASTTHVAFYTIGWHEETIKRCP